MIQLFIILILFVLFVIVSVVFRILFAARQVIFGGSTQRQRDTYNSENNNNRQEYDEASVKAKRFDKSKAEDVEFEVIKE